LVIPAVLRGGRRRKQDEEPEEGRGSKVHAAAGDGIKREEPEEGRGSKVHAAAGDGIKREEPEEGRGSKAHAAAGDGIKREEPEEGRGSKVLAMRLAHFSDIHVSVAPLRDPLELRHFKVALGTLNHYATGRFLHFAGVERRVARLLEDAEAQAPDHVLCTGDLTVMSQEDEFARCARLFGDRAHRPEAYTVLPGNHDRYTRAATEALRFERAFSKVFAADSPVPFVKRLSEGVVLVVLDVSRPTYFASTGELGPMQLARTREILTDTSLAKDFVVLALHYGLLRESGRPDYPTHRLVDYRELIDVIDRDDVHLDLVLHGHIHRAYTVRTKRRLVVCAGSATDLAHRCGYNVYSIDVERRAVEIERRVWNRRVDRYERSPR
jgi:3',5'-cyclic AMP phosphodiesterase CpdA